MGIVEKARLLGVCPPYSVGLIFFWIRRKVWSKGKKGKKSLLEGAGKKSGREEWKGELREKSRPGACNLQQSEWKGELKGSAGRRPLSKGSRVKKKVVEKGNAEGKTSSVMF